MPKRHARRLRNVWKAPSVASRPSEMSFEASVQSTTLLQLQVMPKWERSLKTDQLLLRFRTHFDSLSPIMRPRTVN